MINNISTNQSEWLQISSPSTYINNSYSNNGVDGQIRFNFSSQTLDVFNSGTWTPMAHTAHINPSNRMIEILNWAESKLQQEREVMKMIETNATVADAYNQFKKAEEQLKVVMTLTNQDQV